MEYPSSSPHRRIRAEHSRTAYLVSSFSQILKNSTSPASSSSFKRRNVMLHRELGSIPSDNLDFAGDSQMMNRNEKKLLQEVNDRFARFIEKVRCLEKHNTSLEKEIGDIRERTQFSLTDQYDPVIKDLRKQVHDIAQQNRHIEVELDHLEQDLYSLKSKCEQETGHRTNIESRIMEMQMHINDAHLSKMELDIKSQSLVKEIHFLKQKHKEEVSEMMAQIHEAHLSTETKSLGTTDITTALRDIRRQLEGHACSDTQQAEERFHALMANIMEATEKNRKTLEVTKQEIFEHKRQLQTKSIGLDTLKGAKEALEKQLNVLEDDHDAEVNQYQDTIRSLKLELRNSKFEMSGYCQQYQDLLNVKMALDVEITSYRKLLEGEEMRLDSCTQGPVSYVYRQSPVYTLPYFTRQRGQCYKLMPQFKFVEEIITETTREVELSETEETESERSSSEGLCGEKGSTDGEADVAEAEVTTEEEDATGSSEEGGAQTATATDGTETGEDDEGEEGVMGAEVLPDAEETTEGKQSTVILQDQSTETEDMAERIEECDDVRSAAGDMEESLVEITQEYWSTATEQPITEHGAEVEQPITEQGAEGQQPITEQGADAEQPITEQGAEGQQPITEQGADAEQPITEQGAEAQQPITEHRADAEQPITEHGAEAQPITEHRAEVEQLITEHGAEVEQPITEHGAEAEQLITEHGAEVEQPITEHGAEAQPITEHRAEVEQLITEHGAEAEQPITEHGAEAEQPITEQGAEETGSQSTASSGPLEMDPIEQPHPGGSTQNKPQQENNREKDEMFTVGKDVSGIKESLEEEANGLVKVQETMQPVKAKEVEILGHIGKEKKASGVDVKPDESPVNGTVDPVTSPDQTGPKLALGPKCEPDTPLTTIAEPKYVPEKSLGSLSTSEDRSTPTTTLKATPRMETDSAKEEPTVLHKEESSSEMNISSDTMEDPGERPAATVIDGDKKS